MKLHSFNPSSAEGRIFKKRSRSFYIMYTNTMYTHICYTRSAFTYLWTHSDGRPPVAAVVHRTVCRRSKWFYDFETKNITIRRIIHKYNIIHYLCSGAQTFFPQRATKYNIKIRTIGILSSILNYVYNI